MRRYKRDFDSPVLHKLFREGLTDPQIAARMGVSPDAVSCARCREGLTRDHPAKKPPEPLLPVTPDPSCPVAMARKVLKERVTERSGAYWLDGRCPVGAKQLVREANRVRVRNGEPEIGPPGWRP